MASKLYYSVVESWDGEITVSSFLGRNRTEERRYAQSASRKVHLLTTDHDEAQRYAQHLREAAEMKRGSARP